MTIEAETSIVDTVIAELVDCAPAPTPPIQHELVQPASVSPVDRAREASIQHVGAEPPPAVAHG